VTSDSTTQARWPVLDERRIPLPQAARPARRRSQRSVWLLTGLAFICGGLVSAAAFSIGWRNQSQRNTAAETALAAATARTHALERRVSLLQASLSDARSKAAAATASEQKTARSAARIGSEATASSNAAASVSSGAGTLTASAARVGSELKTLETYLTTTPADQLDPGYISSQVGYLSRQLSKLQSAADSLGTSIASFQTSARRLAREATAVSSH
jgi:cell division septum initiation protein DivIVA